MLSVCGDHRQLVSCQVPRTSQTNGLVARPLSQGWDTASDTHLVEGNRYLFEPVTLGRYSALLLPGPGCGRWFFVLCHNP